MNGQSDSQPPSPSGSLERRLNDNLVVERKMKAFLLVVDGPRAGRLHLLEGPETLIGRGASCDIRLQDEAASQEHARVLSDDTGYSLVDGGSRNGTFVNGEQVTEHLLSNRDTIRIGETGLAFLSEGDLEATRSVQARGGDTRLVEPAGKLARLSPGGGMVHHTGEEGIVETVRKIVQLLKMARRHIWLLIPLPLIGAALGVLSLRVFPPPQLAVALVKLIQSAQTNPVDNRFREQRRGEPRLYFDDPEQSFLNPELIRRTLADIGASEVPQAVAAAQKDLSIEHTQGQVYKVRVTQASLPEPDYAADRFLALYLENFLTEETDRAIKVLSSEAKFLENQLRSVEGELKQVEDDLLLFKRQHIDSLPDTAADAFRSKESFLSRRSDLESQITRLSMQRASLKRRLSAGETKTIRRSERAAPIRAELAAKRRQIAEKKSLGLTELHPDVRRLKQQEADLEKELLALPNESSTFDVDKGALALQRELDRVSTELEIARREIGQVQKQLSSASGRVAVVPEVGVKLGQLTRRQQSLQSLQRELFERHRKTLVQVDLERAEITARYDIVLSPRLQSAATPLFYGKRIGAGLAAGLILAVLIGAVREFLWLLKRYPQLMESGRARPNVP